MKKCPLCDSPNPDNQEVCLNCSVDIAGVFPDTRENDAADKAHALRDPVKPKELKLVVAKGKSPGMEYLLDEYNMTVGRHDSDAGYYPDIDLFDQEDEGEWTLSRRHARLEFNDGSLFVYDLESANGTFINKPVRIESNKGHPIQPGDVIAVGSKVVLKLKEHAAP